MLDMRSAGDSDSDGKVGDARRTEQGSPTDPFARPGHAAKAIASPPNDGSPDRLRSAMASVDLLSELDEIALDELVTPPMHASAGNATLEEILVAELGSELGRDMAIPPAADDRVPHSGTPRLPDTATAEAAIDRQLLLSRIVRARDAIIAEEQAARRVPVEQSRPNAGPGSSPEYETEIDDKPAGIAALFTLRRLAIAASAIALVAGAGLTAGGSGFAGLPPFDSGFSTAFSGSARLSAQADPAPAAAAAGAQANATIAAEPAAPIAPETNASAGTVAGDAGAVDEARLAERLGTARTLALLPEAEATPAELAIRARLVETGMEGGAEPPARAGGETPVPDQALPVLTGLQASGAMARPQPPVEPAGKRPRDRLAVDKAMASAMGLEDLGEEQRLALRDMLVAGDCPSTALASLLGRAPVVATRDLVRNLENGC